MVVDAAELAVASRLIRELSSRVYRPSSRHQYVGEHAAQLEWLDYQGGSFDGLPMRLEVLAVAADAAVHDAVLDAADVVIIVADGADVSELRRRLRRTPTERRAATAAHPEDQSPGRRSLEGRIAELGRLRQRRAELDRPALVLFEHERSREPSVTTAALLRGFGLPADTLSTATSTDGAGLRYGVALAVRAGVHRLRARDAAQRPRTPATEPDGLWRALTGPTTTSSTTRRPAPPSRPDSSARAEPDATPLLSALTGRRAPHPPPAPGAPDAMPPLPRAAATATSSPPSGQRVARPTSAPTAPPGSPPSDVATHQTPAPLASSPAGAAQGDGTAGAGSAVDDAEHPRPDGRRRALARLIAALRG